MMPGLGGPEVIRRLRHEDGSLPFEVLVLTGAPEIVEPLRDELGTDAVMKKPFDIGTLAARVRALAHADRSGSPHGWAPGAQPPL
jgi:DNA-binding response OmpR family regulator